MMTKPKTQPSYHNDYTGARVRPYDWQLKLQKGCYYRIVTECNPTVYGEILETLHEKGFFLVLAYSESLPDGHKVVQCVQEFEEARARHWKTVEDEVQ